MVNRNKYLKPMSRSVGILFTAILLFFANAVLSQNVGINSTGAAANSSAMLDVSSTTKGVLIPRMTHAQMNAITTPATGLIVYDTDSPAGFYYYNGSSWVSLLSASTGWSITGNAGTIDGTNFIGTTDSVAFALRVNNQKAGRIDPGLKNTFYGYKAGNAISGGTGNLFEGQYAGLSNTSGSHNIAMGNYALKSNIANGDNFAIGDSALYAPDSYDLFAIGNRAGKSTTTGFRNLYIGNDAGYHTTSGFYNQFVGAAAGYNNTSGTYNYAFGRAAFYLNKTSNYNLSVGREAGYSHVSGDNNIFIGMFAGLNDTSGTENTLIGNNSGDNNLGGKYLTFLGYTSGGANTSGSYNTFVGDASCGGNTSGSNNTAVGYQAGLSNTTGSSNTYLGYQANGTAFVTNATAIGANASVSSSNSLVLGAAGVNVGIGVSAPLTTLEVNGYTMLGSNAPQVKMLKLTGTTSSVQGGAVNTAHGLTLAKILSVNVLVDYGGGVIPPSYKGSTGYEFNVYVTGTDVVVWNQTANSVNILSRPFRILITYEQ
ncbi:MAG: hypothetical protein ACJ77K_17140 [Bacteroidia bacterium]